jgi:DNA (cytosine-5)-methyltransferase 1
MRYGTVCSGIEAPSVAWEPLGWEPMWFSEIEKFPKAVLAHHYPNVPDLGDMTKVNWDDTADIDVLCGGTPCQAFSVAGLRRGLADPRGNLALEFLKIVDRKRPRWVVWENVPGVLSSSGGRDFGSFLGALVELGYGFAYRVLDAQFFGVPQRRRRVFLVGHSGGWSRPAAVLLERESLSGNPPPSREAGQEVAANAHGGSHWSGGPHPSLNQSHNTGGIGLSNQELFSQQGGGLVAADVAQSITSSGPPFSRTGNSRVEAGALVVATNSEGSDGFTLTRANIGNHLNNQTPLISTANSVRRLTPIECERLQGFPDNYTRIPWRNKSPEGCPDGPRYKALGNSMAVPVVRWIGERIMQVEATA